MPRRPLFPSCRCALTLRKFECFRAFPICEFGRDYALLCKAACETVVSTCAREAPGVTLSALGCAGTVLDLDTSLHCYSLAYAGAPRARCCVIS